MPFIGKQGTNSNSKITKYVTTVGSGGQTNFSVSVDTGSDEVQVFLNGVLLKETADYTLSTTQVALGSASVEDDIVEIHVYRSFVLADAVKSSGDTMTGELEVPTVKLSSNVIKASDGGSTLTLDTSDNLTVAGNIQVGGNIIKASDGGSTITLDTSDNVTIAGITKTDDIQEKTTDHGVEIEGLLLKDGNLVIGTAGKGVDFAVQTTSSATGTTPSTGANEVLDHYEEGTWTALIEGTSSAGTATYVTNVGNYTRVGRLVVATNMLIWNSGNGTGDLKVSGLPFSTVGSGAITVSNQNQVSLSSGYFWANGYFAGGSTVVFAQFSTGGGTVSGVLYDGQGELIITIVYSSD